MRTILEGEGIRVSRANSKGYVMIDAGCHKSKSGRSCSLHIGDGHYRCWGCGARGDLIDFIRMRHQCSFPDACRRLGIWRDAITPAEQARIAVEARKRQREREEQQSQRERERQERIRARDWLHRCERMYRESSARLTELRQGDEAEIHWLILALVTDEIRDAEAAYLHKAGLV